MEALVYILNAAIVVLLVFSAYHCFYSWKTGVPTVSTSKEVRNKMVALIPHGPQRVVEMGSGWGGLAISAAKARPDCKIVAIEYSAVPAWVSMLRKAIDPSLKNLEFRRGDFFALPLKETDVVLCYLLEPMLEKLKAKFMAELPSHAIIISNHYQVPGWTPVSIEKVEKFFEKGIFVYNKGSDLAA